MSVYLIGIAVGNCSFPESAVLLVETLDDPPIFGLFNNSYIGLANWAKSGI